MRPHPSIDADHSELGAATAVTRRADGDWDGHVQDGWDMGGFPNGGYLVSIAARAALEATGRDDLVAATAHFVRPASPGSLRIRTEMLKEGRRLSTATVALEQAGQEKVRLLVATGQLPDGAEQTRWNAGPPALPPPEECVHATPMPGLRFQPPPITERVELRLDPQDVGFTLGLAAARPRMTGWARLADGAPAITPALPLFADAFPPAIFNAGPPLSWVPTVELSVQVRKRPAAGWLRCAFTTRVVSGGYLEEDGEIWDSAGDLVALSRQLALAPRHG